MRTSDAKRAQIWNRALEMMRDNLHDLADSPTMNEDQRWGLTTAAQLCDCQINQRAAAWHSNEELAAKYGCSPRTICNWRRREAPLHRGQWTMLDWCARQRCLPAGTEAKFARQLAKRRGEDPETPATLLQRARALAELSRLAKRARACSVQPATG
jgi:hypothetical protein